MHNIFNFIFFISYVYICHAKKIVHCMNFYTITSTSILCTKTLSLNATCCSHINFFPPKNPSIKNKNV